LARIVVTTQFSIGFAVLISQFQFCKTATRQTFLRLELFEIYLLAASKRLAEGHVLSNKPALSVVTFVLSSLFFVQMLGSFSTAITFMVLLACHEMGHYWACQRRSVPASVPIFTPFGALITIDSAPDAETEAYIGIGGPVAGTLSSIVALVVGLMFDSPGIVLGAYYSFFLNLFNLTPWAPLDGGRICQAINRKLWVVGAILLGLLIFSQPLNGINLVVFAMIIYGGINDIKYRAYLEDQNPAYYTIDDGDRFRYIVAYLGLAGFLIAMLFVVPLLGSVFGL
jgi:Zn-dependent protease